MESNEVKLQFLDCIVHRESSRRLRTNVHKRPTDVDMGLHCRLAHSRLIFASIAMPMFRRARKLCSEGKYKLEGHKEATKKLTKRGDPEKFISS